MAYSSRPTSTDLLTKLVNQAHTFDLGEVLIFNGANYVPAQADSLAGSQGIGIVSIIVDANNFYLTQTGWVNGLTMNAPYAAGSQYYLSPLLPGELTTVAPTAIGDVYLPCFVADSTTSGYFYTGPGRLIESPTAVTWTVVTVAGPTQMVANNGYVSNSGVTVQLDMPAAALLGDTIYVANEAGQFQINIGANTVQVASTLGNTSITSNSVGDSVTLVATGATTWIALAGAGTILTVV